MSNHGELKLRWALNFWWFPYCTGSGVVSQGHRYGYVREEGVAVSAVSKIGITLPPKDCCAAGGRRWEYYKVGTGLVGYYLLHNTILMNAPYHVSTSHHIITLHYNRLHYPTLPYTTLHYTTLHYTTRHTTHSQHYTTEQYTPLHYTTLHYTTLHYTTLHYTTLQDTLHIPNTTLQNSTLHYTTFLHKTLPFQHITNDAHLIHKHLFLRHI